jgi:hypothetical protein
MRGSSTSRADGDARLEVGRPIGVSLSSPKWVRSSLVVLKIRTKYAGQVAFIPDDDMVQTLAADAPVQPLDIGVLPRASISCQDLLDSQCTNASPKGGSVRAAAVPEQVLGGRVPWKGFGDLLRGPVGGRMSGDIEVNDFAPGVAHYDEYE